MQRCMSCFQQFLGTGEETKLMRFQIAIIYSIIIIAFLGSGLFFSTLNTDELKFSVETETDLTSTLLVNSINRNFSPISIEEGTYAAEQYRSLLVTDNNMGQDILIRIFSGDGTVYYQHEVLTGPDGSEKAVLSEPLSDIVQTVRQEGLYSGWTGIGNRFLLSQQYCIIRPLFGGRLFLMTLNSCVQLQAMQRRQFALFMSIDIIMMLITIVLITNIIYKYRKRVIRLATTDELTGLINRKSFHTEFSEHMAADGADKGSIFLLDIDFFKQINDNYGHSAGDNALRILAGEIADMVKEKGGFAGRWGGDEFIGVLRLSADRALSELKALCKRVEALRPEDGFTMTISAGVAPLSEGTDLLRAAEKADEALYISKEKGRNTASLYDGAQTEEKPVIRDTVVRNVSDAVAYGSTISLSEAPAPVKTETENGLVRRVINYVRSSLVAGTILGVRWMAPFVAGGGILIALAFLFDAAAVDFSSLSLAERSNFGSITPAAALLKSIGETTFNFMLPVFAGFMAYGIGGEPAFMAGFAGGYMTIESQSGFIGAMIAGLAAGVITGELQAFFDRMPGFVRKAAPIVIYPVSTLLLMQALSYLVISPVSGSVGWLFARLLDSCVQVGDVASGALSGMMMATDMGGIINKVAYNYGVEGLNAGRTGLMASVMIGGMVPPIGIFLSMLFFRNKYTGDEWDRGPGTLFMGLSFITEGALPYVFTDMVRVIPSCMAGSALAGALSAAFGCTLPAPHGGIFVFPVMGHPVLYGIALLIGSGVTALLLGLWKKAKGDGPVQ